MGIDLSLEVQSQYQDDAGQSFEIKRLENWKTFYNWNASQVQHDFVKKTQEPEPVTLGLAHAIDI
jgi:hypothetical protein